MKQALFLLVLILALLESGRRTAGDAAMMAIAYGAMAQIALLMATTFLWLWFERTTPLALGMAWSWLAAALFAGWWWGLNLSGQALPVVHPQAITIMQAIGLVGALLHFSVIHRSFGFHGAGFLWPVFVSLVVSAVVYLLP
jgi:hypothetical protein